MSNNLYIFSLFLKYKNITLQDKYVLLMFLREFRPQPDPWKPFVLRASSMKEFAQQIGISEKLFAHAFKSFTDLGLWEEGRIEIDEKDYVTITILGALKKQLIDAGHNFEEITNLDLVTELFEPSFDHRYKQHRCNEEKYTEITEAPSFRYATKYLLGVLLAHADRAGAVHSLGIGDLAHLTAMSKDRVNSQLDTLKRLGFIHTQTPGLTGSRLFGIAKGSFFLNLKHELFGGIARSGALSMYLPGKVITNQNQRRESYDVLRIARRGEKQISKLDINVRSYRFDQDSNVFFDKKLALINEFFVCGTLPSLSAYMQVRIEEYASRLLSVYWDALKEEDDPERAVSESLLQKIRSDFIPSKFDKGRGDRGFLPTEDQINSLSRYVLSLSIKLAQNIQQLLMLAEEKVAYDKMDHCVLPAVENDYGNGVYPRYLCVVSICKKEENYAEKLAYFRHKNNRDITVRVLPGLVDIGVEESELVSLGFSSKFKQYDDDFWEGIKSNTQG